MKIGYIRPLPHRVATYQARSSLTVLRQQQHPSHRVATYQARSSHLHFMLPENRFNQMTITQHRAAITYNSLLLSFQAADKKCVQAA
ncbi:hypothetical protein [Stenoxybacter acetivorans]|uniref:hypothetical protein n=1 Tax=Stenoxybacter acetivorans TaxID=422441 RepID=UPI0012EB4812|nr:hypothetical protein [Stenoxybacter acetivorans]